MLKSRTAPPIVAMGPLSAGLFPPQCRRRLPFERIALALQGGGALGAYQAGVYQALAEAALHPDWVAGISIGAINAAIIAGNPPESRVDKLREFWELVSSPQMPWLGTFHPCSQWRRNGGQSARREPAAQRRSRAIVAEPMVGGFGPVVGRDGVFHTSHFFAVALPGRVNGGHQLLRHAAIGANTRATDRFRSHQRWPHAPQCRRRQRTDRRLRLFRQDDPPHWTQTHHGERCLAARLSGSRDRRRALLGWWPRLEHAAGLDGGCRAGEGHTGVPGRSVVRAGASFLAA